MRAILRELGTGNASADARAWDPYAAFVLAGLTFFGVAAVLTVRRDRKSAPPRRTLHWRPLLLIGGGAALHVLLAETLGFIVAAALLFWLVARAFDPRHPVRDAACALGVAASSYALFAYALQLPLPAGVLGAWL